MLLLTKCTYALNSAPNQTLHLSFFMCIDVVKCPELVSIVQI